MLLLPSEWEILLWTLKQTYFFLHFYTFSVWEYVCAHTSELTCFYFYIRSTLLHYFSFTMCFIKQNGILIFQKSSSCSRPSIGVMFCWSVIFIYLYIPIDIYCYIKSNNTNYIIAHRERENEVYIAIYRRFCQWKGEREMILPPVMALIFSWRELSDGLWVFLSNWVKEFVSCFWQRKNENC